MPRRAGKRGAERKRAEEVSFRASRWSGRERSSRADSLDRRPRESGPRIRSARATTSASWCSIGWPRSCGLTWENSEKWSALWAKSGRCHFGQARDLHESQWRAARAIANFYKIAPAEILVVLDDLRSAARPVAPSRRRAAPGGHNGLESIFVHFGTEAIPRLRVGIGAAPTRRRGRLRARPIF